MIWRGRLVLVHAKNQPSIKVRSDNILGHLLEGLTSRVRLQRGQLSHSAITFSIIQSESLVVLVAQKQSLLLGE